LKVHDAALQAVTAAPEAAARARVWEFVELQAGQGNDQKPFASSALEELLMKSAR
jgi:hypothetical protein